MVKALAQTFRWRKLLETGAFATVEEIAAAEKINPSYVSRVPRLALLAPEIVEAILDGRQPATMTLAVLMRPFAGEWKQQTASGLRPGTTRSSRASPKGHSLAPSLTN
jgi:hypothetical protein